MRTKFYLIDVHIPAPNMSGSYLGWCEFNTIAINPDAISALKNGSYSYNQQEGKLTEISMINGQTYFTEKTPDDLMKYFYSDPKVYKVLYGRK